MLEDEILSDHFAYSTKDIRGLRVADETFDAICRDYLSLSSEVARAVAQGKPGTERYLADARDSLSALAKEIESKLLSFFSADKSNT